MEDDVSETAGEQLLSGGIEVPFAKIESALARCGDGAHGSGRAVTATVVLVGPPARLGPVASTFEQMAEAAGVRTILISTGTLATPNVRVSNYAVAIEGLLPRYLNNAVAALRLSSLPTLVWWRGGAPGALDGLARLADRLVLDTDDPLRVWVRAAALAERTALSDLRWTRLTRWRSLMAHVFDIPEIRAAVQSFNQLQIDGSDEHTARLFAGWLYSCLQWRKHVTTDWRSASGAHIQQVRLSGGGQDITLRLVANGACIEWAAQVVEHSGASQIVPIGDQSLGGLIAEELRVRSRDLAFEQALGAMEDVA